jgi:hypothetical protein
MGTKWKQLVLMFHPSQLISLFHNYNKQPKGTKALGYLIPLTLKIGTDVQEHVFPKYLAFL